MKLKTILLYIRAAFHSRLARKLEKDAERAEAKLLSERRRLLGDTDKMITTLTGYVRLAETLPNNVTADVEKLRQCVANLIEVRNKLAVLVGVATL